MEYYFYAAAFVLGVSAMYLFTRFYNRRLLSEELRYYRKELKKKKKRCGLPSCIPCFIC